MKQWWFWYVIRQLIKKLIILRLLFIYFNYVINRLINQWLYTAPSHTNSDSMCCKAASPGAEGAPAMSCAGVIVIYLFIWHGGDVLWMYLYLFILYLPHTLQVGGDEKRVGRNKNMNSSVTESPFARDFSGFRFIFSSYIPKCHDDNAFVMTNMTNRNDQWKINSKTNST